MRRKLWVSSVGVIVAIALIGVGDVRAGEAEGVPTFTKDVAPILFNNCVICHREGEIAPMSLVSYEETRPWSRAIKDKVVTREMPPWYADRRFGEFRNERGLTQAEIEVVVAWVDGGAPRGSEADLPAVPIFSSGWQHPTGVDPDVVLNLPVDLQLPDAGEIPTFGLWQTSPFEEDRFLEAIEMRPGNRAVLHHAGLYSRDVPAGTEVGAGEAWAGGPHIETGALVPLHEGVEFDDSVDPEELEAERQLSIGAIRDAEADDIFAVDGTDKMVSYVPGRGFEQFWPGVGKRIRADRHLRWSMHYQSTGKPETDRSQIGLWLQKVQATHEVLTRRVGQTHVVESMELVAMPTGDGRGSRARIPVIPPHADDWAITGITAFRDDVTLYAMSPHMHLRGKDATYIVTYPDGREEIILSVPTYDFNWQLHYELAAPLKIPAGSTIKTVGHFDNSLANRYNPAPDREVYWAEQSWDEMYNGFMEYSIDKLDLTKDTPSTEE
jgi:hypothetical protein